MKKELADDDSVTDIVKDYIDRNLGHVGETEGDISVVYVAIFPKELGQVFFKSK